MGEFIDAIWGWDEQVQRDYHAPGFATGRWQIITADGTDVGMLNVEYRDAAGQRSSCNYSMDWCRHCDPAGLGDA